MVINTDIVPSKEETAVALGFFDGVHKGHKSIILDVVNEEKNSLIPTIFTFSYDSSIKSSSYISNEKERLSLFEILCIEQVYDIDFLKIMSMEPSLFVNSILKNTLKAKKVYCGFNYHFGREGLATAYDLKKLCKEQNIDVFIRDPVKYKGTYISSTRIKNCLSMGDIKSANDMLGRYFSIDSKIIHGIKLGRKLGFPTINQAVDNLSTLPRFGVYASRVLLNDQYYYSLTNIGKKPTLGTNKLSIETWIPDYCGEELYGKNIKVEFLSFIRDEKKFKDLNHLKAAILNDKLYAKKIYSDIK